MTASSPNEVLHQEQHPPIALSEEEEDDDESEEDDEGNDDHEDNQSATVSLEELLDGGLVFREVTADTNSSISILGRRILRQYASEFVLPDDTRVAIGRREITYPSDDSEEVTLCLSIGLRLNEQQLAWTRLPTPTTLEDEQGVDSGAVTSMSATSSDDLFVESSPEGNRRQFEVKKTSGKQSKDGEDDELDFAVHPAAHPFDLDNEDGDEEASPNWMKKSSNQFSHPHRTPRSERSKCPHGLRIADYMHDDPWAATILIADASANADLLRQLETGCRLEPEAYRMERVQRKRNWETIIDLHSEPTVRTITLSPSHSETDSIATAYTQVGEDGGDLCAVP